MQPYSRFVYRYGQHCLSLLLLGMSGSAVAGHNDARAKRAHEAGVDDVSVSSILQDAQRAADALQQGDLQSAHQLYEHVLQTGRWAGLSTDLHRPVGWLAAQTASAVDRPKQCLRWLETVQAAFDEQPAVLRHLFFKQRALCLEQLGQNRAAFKDWFESVTDSDPSCAQIETADAQFETRVARFSGCLTPLQQPLGDGPTHWLSLEERWKSWFGLMRTASDEQTRRHLRNYQPTQRVPSALLNEAQLWTSNMTHARGRQKLLSLALRRPESEVGRLALERWRQGYQHQSQNSPLDAELRWVESALHHRLLDSVEAALPALAQRVNSLANEDSKRVSLLKRLHLQTAILYYRQERYEAALDALARADALVDSKQLIPHPTLDESIRRWRARALNASGKPIQAATLHLQAAQDDQNDTAAQKRALGWAAALFDDGMAFEQAAHTYAHYLKRFRHRLSFEERRQVSGWIALNEYRAGRLDAAQDVLQSISKNQSWPLHLWLQRRVDEAMGLIDGAQSSMRWRGTYQNYYQSIFTPEMISVPPSKKGRHLAFFCDTHRSNPLHPIVRAGPVHLPGARSEALQRVAFDLVMMRQNQLVRAWAKQMGADSMSRDSLGVWAGESGDRFHRSGRYAELICQYAERYDLPAALLGAVIQQESGGRANARSGVGARGLMQMMPMTARKTAMALGMKTFDLDALYHPPIAIGMGAWYLKQLWDEFAEHPILAIAAYNAGPIAVRRWWQQHHDHWEATQSAASVQTDVWVEEIPYRETRDYVKRVWGYYIESHRCQQGAVPLWPTTLPERLHTSVGF